MRDAHHRILHPREKNGDPAILDSIKAEADLTEVAVHPRVAPAPAAAPVLAPAAPVASAAPLVAPPVVAPAVPVMPAVQAAPAAHLANIDRLTIPGYYLYFGIPYGTGPVIPGGR